MIMDLTDEQMQGLEERFWEKVAVVAASGCWLWTASTRDGYGQFRVGRKMLKAHRISYLLRHGELSESVLVCHRCDVRRCVNPGHLFPGSQKENVRDMFLKHRDANRRQIGERHPSAKLSFEKAREIREEAATGKYSMSELGRRFGFSRRTVRAVLRGERWAWNGNARVLRRNLTLATYVVFVQSPAGGSQ